ncbi:MAG TPA: hypothetical protein HPP77_04670 [Candidatus Hydrogenedentes bacterium]|nr:hypothetical protein [Candidatus Hydrogenedentota bacterium]HIJ74937.1 hypothetical protein [Candidatus Hydrogenedentota bacterium]
MKRCVVIVLFMFAAVGYSEDEAAPLRRLGAFERMAACHHTIVSTEEQQGHSYVATYILDGPGHYTEVYWLAKIIPGVEIDGTIQWAGGPALESVEDFPGGVQAAYRVGGVRLDIEIVPLLVGRDTTEWDGAALYSFTTDPAAPVGLRCGGGGVLQKPDVLPISDGNVGAEGDVVELAAGTVMLRSAGHPLTVAVAGSGQLTLEPGDAGGQAAAARFETGAGHLVVAFAAESARAATLAGIEPEPHRRAVEDYYATLLANRIETPEPVLDAAFRCALYNLEYNWIEPYGWNECIHHWLALWHMQHTAAAEWIGQTNRSRRCILTAAEHLLPDGAVPQFFPGGQTHRDFGGSNQFFAWQVRHYWEFTGDGTVLEPFAEALDQVIAQTFRENDPDNDLLLAWGQQIGNQEDYISTPFNGTSPTIEGINMLRTRAALERALGDLATAAECEAKVELARERLRTALWQADLGRFAFYRDPCGVLRCDGQYHTLIYPVIWDALDPLDSWTSIRHLRDRFIGEGGEAYCSNNFPGHPISTTGVQAGAAQQPWAALGLAQVGLRNETYRPLLAVARWVMDENHRGAWPEIASERAPAYFSPPAGLFVYTVVEALFGLKVHRPEGYLEVAPSFPDAWSRAALELAEFCAEYRREERRIQYTIRSKEPLERRLRWRLPPGVFGEVLVDGQPAAYRIEPGVACEMLCIDAPPDTETTLTINLEPVDCRVDAPASIAEGGVCTVRTTYGAIDGVDDPCGVLERISFDVPGAVRVSVAPNLLEPYHSYGRLGQLMFSRRTFFVRIAAENGASFWMPADLTVLPRYEAAADGEVWPGEDGLRLLLRNNTDKAVAGAAQLKTVRQTLPFAVEIPPRAERSVSIAMPSDVIARLSPGNNKAEVVFPDGCSVEIALLAREIFTSPEPLAQYARSRLVNVPLPRNVSAPDADWHKVRPWYAYGHLPWAAARPPLEALAGQNAVEVSGAPQVSFTVSDSALVYLSRQLDRPALTIAAPDEPCKKFYLVVVPFLDNHDVFAPVARVTVTLANGASVARTLHFPGDLDWWAPESIVGPFSTAHGARPDARRLLPLLGAGQSDWDVGRPPAFPQPGLWARSLAVRTSTAVMNVIEIDLERPEHVAALTIETIGADPALGIVAVVAETDKHLLDGPALAAQTTHRANVVFDATRADALTGWTLDGDAFSIAPVSHLFDEPTLNSLTAAGEEAVGPATSPAFTIGSEHARLRFRYHGGTSTAEAGPGRLAIQLLDAATNDVLDTLPVVVATPALEPAEFDVTPWRGRRVRLAFIDENAAPAYAWLGVKTILLEPASR